MRTTPGKVKNEKLEDRMKEYESVTTNISLINRIPVYARIDGRAFYVNNQSAEGVTDNV